MPALKFVRMAVLAAGLYSAFAGLAYAGPAENKALVIKAMTGLFIDQDPSVIDKYWDKNYIQHNPRIPNGSDAIKGFAGNMGPNFKYEMGAVLADGDLVAVRGRYTGIAPKPMIGVDMFRVENGKIVEHWDTLQEEVPASQTASGNPMFEPGM